MSTDQITQERIADIEENLKAWRKKWVEDPDLVPGFIGVSIDLFDALTASRAEVQRLTEEVRRSDAGRVEVPELEERDLPYPGKVRPGSYSWQRNKLFAEGYNLARHRSRLSPSPQPATGALDRHQLLPALPASRVSEMVLHLAGCSMEERIRDVWNTARDEINLPQPSADVVVVPRARLAALESIADKIEKLELGPDGRAWTPLHYREFARGELRNALRSSTNHDAQDAGDGR